MNTLHFLVPAALDDPAHPSGGNRYDRMLAAELAGSGWQVRVVRIDAGDTRVDELALAEALTAMPLRDPVLVDGLIAAGAPALVEAHAGRARLVVLVHMVPAETGRPNGYPAVLAAARAVITTSEWARRQLLDRGYTAPARTIAAPPGVERPLPVAVSSSGARLRCVAALLPHKGQDVLLDALTRLRLLEWTCDLIGAEDLDTAFVRKLRRQAQTGSIADRVRFRGPRQTNGIRDLYDGADLLVLPSLVESYGMVATEAIACGVPVVAADTGGLGEAMGAVDGRRPGLLVPPGDPIRLAEALAAWLTRPTLRAELTAAALDRRQELPGWEATAAVAAGVLATVAGQP